MLLCGVLPTWKSTCVVFCVFPHYFPQVAEKKTINGEPPTGYWPRLQNRQSFQLDLEGTRGFDDK